MNADENIALWHWYQIMRAPPGHDDDRCARLSALAFRETWYGVTLMSRRRFREAGDALARAGRLALQAEAP